MNEFFAKVIAMMTFRMLSTTGALLLSASVPALAGTTVTSPLNGATVPTPFILSLIADTCSARPVEFVGYSFDDSPHTAIWKGYQINGLVGPGPGRHTLHVKVWSDQGAVCVTDISVNVGGTAAAVATSSSPALSRVPANATIVSSIQNLGNWALVHDNATSGFSIGRTRTHASPSLSGSSREFATSFDNYGGERYSVQFGDDKNSRNFLYDTWVYIVGTASAFKNLEFDLNQTLKNGKTVIMGFQCDGWSGTWDYTINAGSAKRPVDQWVQSSASCNPQNWEPNQWHHVQIHITHEDSGWVTYQSVWLDGARQDLYARVFSAFDLGWAPALIANFQVDGANSDTTSSIIYLDNMTVYRW